MPFNIRKHISVVLQCSKVMTCVFHRLSDRASTDEAMGHNEDVPPGVKDESRRIIVNPVAGETGTCVKYSYETDGKYTEAIVDCVPGGGPPLHFHRTYDEHLEAIGGDLIIQVGNNEERHVKVGESLDIPRGTLHRFSAGPEGAKFRVRIEPGQPGFEKSIYILFGLARDGLLGADALPKNPVHTAVVADLGGMYFPGAGGVLINGLTTVLAAYARWSGTQEELEEKYWR